MSVDAVWVPVLPSFKSFAKDFEKGTAGVGKSAGERIGKEMADGVERSKAAVEKASSIAAKAHDKVADAAGKVRIAELQLDKVRESGTTVQQARAEEQLEQARRTQARETTNAAQADKGLADAKSKLSKAQDDAAKSAAEQARAIDVQAMSSEEAEKATARFADANVALAATFAAGVGAAALATKGLYDLGSQFDDMFDSIRIGTGASGAAFEGLQESALRVAQSVPAMDGGLSQIGATMADLNTRLGASGPTLETLTSQFVQLQNMGVDADINDVTGALTQFNISADQAPAAMDDLFRISQATGRSVTEITSNLAKSGPALQEFGFGLTESAGLLGALDKAGLDSEKTLGSMTRALSTFAKDGKDPQQSLWETISSIQELTTAGKNAEAIDLANSIFGAKGGVGFVAAVKSGKFEYDGFLNSIGASGDTILGVADETADFAEQWQLFKQMLAVELAPVASRVFGAVGDAMTWIRDNAIPAAAQFVQTMRDWSGPLTIAATVVGALATGMYAYSAAQAVAAAGGFLTFLRNLTILTRAQAAAQFLLNTAMWTNPIFLITAAVVGLVAGFVILWNKSETFRNFWIGLWDGIKNAVQVAWASYIKPAWDALVVGWNLLVAGVSWAWTNILKPVFDGLWTVIRVVAAVLLTVLVTPFLIAWNLLSAGASLVWNAVLKPVFTGLGMVALWVWNSVLSPVFGWIKTGFQLVGAGMAWVWANILKPVWDGIVITAQWVWTNVLSPIFDWIKAGFGLVGDAFAWIWANVIKPAWDALGAGVQWVADNIVHPVFNGLKAGLDKVGEWFDRTVNFITGVWSKIKEATAAPVRFVIDTVYNNGIVKVWNKVAGWVGLDPIEPMELAFASGTSSVLPGYAPGVDNLQFLSTDGRVRLGLSGGEGIARPEVVKAMGPAAFDSLNAAAATGGVGAVRRQLGFSRGGIIDLGGFASGGIVDAMTAIVQQKYPMIQLTSGQRDSADNHGRGMAGDFSNGFSNTPEMLALANDIADTYPNSMELIHEAPGFDRQIKNGQFVGGGGGSWGFYAGAGDHANHVHWAMDTPPTMEFGGGIFTGGSSGGGSMVGRLVRAAFSEIMDPILGSVPEGPGIWGKLPGALATKAVDAVKEFIVGKAPASSVSGDWVGTPGVEQFRPLVEKLLAEKGQPLALTNSVLRRMDQESGGNPNAINNWDSNAAAGIPSKGLMQTIDPTFQAHKDPGFDNIWDPESNIRASMNYALATYGGLAAAYDRAGGYDQGGILAEGVTLAVNASGKPEAILTNSQWRDVGDLVKNLGALTPEMRRWVDDGIDVLEKMANGVDEWAKATDQRGRIGTPEEFLRQAGQEYGSAFADQALGLVGLDGIVGGKLNESTAGLLRAIADGPVFEPADLLDEQGRVIGSQLRSPDAAPSATPSGLAPDTAGAIADLTSITPSAATLEPSVSPPAGGDTVVVVLPSDKSAFSRDEVKEMLKSLDEKVDAIEVKIEEKENEPAGVGAGIGGIV